MKMLWLLIVITACTPQLSLEDEIIRTERIQDSIDQAHLDSTEVVLLDSLFGME
jgi:hypothetical protein